MKQQVAIYLRLSQEDVDKRTNAAKDESNSISAQRSLVMRHLDEDLLLSAFPRLEFCDDGFSGTNFERPAFQRMIDLTKKGEISCIVVKDLSRFGRDYIEVGDYLEHIFPFLGIRFISINDHYDSARFDGKTVGMNVAFNNLIYDYYSKDLSSKVKSAMHLKQREARYVNTIPYGYRRDPNDKHNIIPDPNTSLIVKRIFHDIASGIPTTELARRLNEEGVPTPAQYKKLSRKRTEGQLEIMQMWHHTTIHNIIGNIKYTGTMVNHTRESRFIRDKNQRRVPESEWYVRTNAHEALVSQAEFDAAHNAIHHKSTGNRRITVSPRYVYYCGHCGRKLAIENGSILTCSSRRVQPNTDCDNIHFKISKIEDIVFAALKTQIEIREIKVQKSIGEGKNTATDHCKTMAAIQRSIDGMNRQKLTLYETYRNGEITATEYLSCKDAISQSQEAQRAKLRNLEVQYTTMLREADAAVVADNQLKQIVQYSEDELRARMYEAIERVIVYGENDIEIVWKFSDLL